MKINWKVVIPLSIFALIRPLMSMIGMTEVLGQPYMSLTLTLIISIVWIAAMIYKDIGTPIQHLTAAGILYTLFVIILSGILSPVLLDELAGPLIYPFAIVSVFMTNVIWGSITGVISWGIMRLIK